MTLTTKYRLVHGNEDCPSRLTLSGRVDWNRAWTRTEQDVAEHPDLILELNKDKLAAVLFDDLLQALLGVTRPELESTLYDIKGCLRRGVTHEGEAREAQRVCRKIDEILAGRVKFLSRVLTESPLTTEEAARL